MKRNIIYLAVIAAIAIGCAKTAPTGANDGAIRFFQAWQKIFYPQADSTALGAYILEKQQGSGREVKAEGYAITRFIITDLDGNITSYTDEETARKLGEYNETAYYGPKVLNTISGKVQAGVADVLIGMKVGGHVKAAIPSWLMTSSKLGGKEDYMKQATDSPNFIYDITITDFTEDINAWQTDSIGRYFKSHSDIFGNMTVKDTVKGMSGMYYKQLKKASDTTSFKKDTTIYINYTGKLLNGKVFDTTNERIAKDNGLYKPSRTYKPMKVTWGERASDIKLGDGSVNNGFAQTLWQMRAMEKGIGIFISSHGYGATGSGKSIPPYSPLLFEIEIVANPEKK